MKDILNVLGGVPVGFMLSFALGPVFFSLIHYSIKRGFWSSIYIAAGVILADIILIATVFSSVQLFLPNGDNVKFWVTIVGGMMLLVMGVSNFFKKKNDEKIEENKGKTNFLLLLNGFLLNFLNPANFFAWLALSSEVHASGTFSASGELFFYTGCLIGIFTTEVAIAYFASLLQRFLDDKKMQMINYTMGVIFIICGLFLLKSAFS
jgi:threonine/homoserine/homoserine lactone efflux protein